MTFMETIIGVFVKEGVSYAAGSLKDVRASRNSVARRFYALYQSLEEVHDAYRTAVVTHNENTMAEYDKKLRRFGERVDDLIGILRIYGNDTLLALRRYYQDTPIEPDPVDVVLRGMKWEQLSQSDFNSAHAALQDFIRQNFKMEDLV